MKTPTSFVGNMKLPSFLLLTSYFLLGGAANAAPPGAATPYTFIGRVMDSSHQGFDTNRVCVLRATDASGQVLVESKTFFRENTRNNYALRIPVATAEADGFALQGDPLTITATDDNGKEWHGVIPESICGGANLVREVDIILGEDADGDGIDDALLEQLLAQWEASEFWEPGVEFDPNADHDGDGVSTLAEALAGTNPFDESEVFAITSFTPGTNGVAVEFSTAAGRIYELQTTSDLTATNWASTTPATLLATPTSARPSKAMLYLLPATNPPVFFRVVAE
jgi:hypothetical protein